MLNDTSLRQRIDPEPDDTAAPAAPRLSLIRPPLDPSEPPIIVIGPPIPPILVPSPLISGFSPASGARGTQVTINGSGFIGTQFVRFGGADSNAFTVAADTQIIAQVPQNAASGPVTVTVGGPNGSASGGSFTVLASSPLPIVSSFFPLSGQFGASITISGSNFVNVTQVSFNGTPAGFVVNSSTSITATVPATATSGPIRVTTAAGTAQSSSSFTINPVAVTPTISSFAPSSGQAGTAVTITGAQLGTATAVRFNGKNAAAFTVQSAGQISAVVPLGATSGPISIVTTAGTAVSVPAFTVLPGALPGTRMLRHGGSVPQPQTPPDVVPVLIRAGGPAFMDSFTAERTISGLRILDDVQITVVGKLPKGTVSVQPTRVQTFTDVVKVMLQAGVATPPSPVYTVEVRGKSLIDGEDYDPIRYEIGVDSAVLVSIDPSSASVRAGKSTTYTVSLDRSPGAMGLPVSLSVADLPDGATGKLGETPTGGASTTLKITTLQSTPVGEKKFVVSSAATFQGAPVEIRDRKATLNVKEPRLKLVIDPNKQSQTVEAGQAADYPFMIERNEFAKPLTVEFDRPSFVTDVVQTPSGKITGDSFTLRYVTDSRLKADVSQSINVKVRDDEGTVMASAVIQLSVQGALTVALEIQDKEDAREVAGKPVSLGVVIRKSRPSPVLDLLVTNRAELESRNITATVTPSSTPGTMATLNVTTRINTAVGMYPIQLEARFDNQTVATDSVTLVVLGSVRLAVDDTDLPGVPGQTLSTTLRVTERIGFPDLVLIGIDVNGRPLDAQSEVQVVLGSNPVLDQTPVFLTIRSDEESGVSNSIFLFPDIPDNLKELILIRAASVSVDVK